MSDAPILRKYPELRRIFLQALARYGNWSAAASAVRLTVHTAMDYAKENAEFAQQCQMAEEEHRARIERAIYERAIEGVEEPRFNNLGAIVGQTTKYSDTLLLAYAKRHLPQYREGDVSRTEVSVNGSVDHTHSLDHTKLTEGQRSALRVLLGGARQGATLDLKPAQLIEAAEEPEAEAE